jgi:hypothetical protein
MCPIMQQNESTTDRVIRLIAAVILLGAGIFAFPGGVLGVIFDILGAVMLVTGALGFCPLYKIFGFSTKK